MDAVSGCFPVHIYYTSLTRRDVLEIQRERRAVIASRPRDRDNKPLAALQFSLFCTSSNGATVSAV